MLRYLTLFEVLELHRRIIASTGGSHGIRNLAGLEAALAQPRLTFDQNVDQQERVILNLAAGKINRDEFAAWLNDHIVRL